MWARPCARARRGTRRARRRRRSRRSAPPRPRRRARLATSAACASRRRLVAPHERERRAAAGERRARSRRRCPGSPPVTIAWRPWSQRSSVHGEGRSWSSRSRFFSRSSCCAQVDTASATTAREPELRGGVQRPVRIGQVRPAERDEIGAPGGDDAVHLVGVGDVADGDRRHAGLVADRDRCTASATCRP